MEKKNLKDLERSENSYLGHTNYLKYTIAEIEHIAKIYGGTKQKELERELVQLVINSR